MPRPGNVERGLRLALVAAAAVAAFTAGCARQEPPRPAAALVNGQAITQDELDLEIRLQPLPVVEEEKIAAARQEVLEELIDQVLLLQEARRLGVTQSREEIENQMALARAGTSVEEFTASLKNRGLEYAQWEKRFLRQIQVNELIRRKIRSQLVVKRTEIKDYYWEHLGEFRRRQKIKLSQIFCPRPEDIRAALKELQLGDPFSEVARRYSQGPESLKGGELGWVDNRDLPKSVAKAAFALKKGRFSDVVKSPYGYHILLVLDSQHAGNPKLDDVAPEIHEVLLSEKEQPLYQALLAQLRNAADIRRTAFEEKHAEEEK
jgi:peptidyl-prolyl cis-trans isomerase C